MFSVAIYARDKGKLKKVAKYVDPTTDAPAALVKLGDLFKRLDKSKIEGVVRIKIDRTEAPEGIVFTEAKPTGKKK